MRPFNNVDNKVPSGTYCRVKLEFMKYQPLNSSETPLEYNQDQMLSRV